MALALLFPGLVPSRYDHVRSFVEASPHAQRRFAVADDVLGYSLRDAYAVAAIDDWEVYEVGYLALTMALTDWATERAERLPDVCTGQSFGAFMAAVWSGALRYEDAVALVRDSVAVETSYFTGLDVPLACLFFHRLALPQVRLLLDEAPGLELSVVLEDGVHAVSGPAHLLDRFEVALRLAGGMPIYRVGRAEHCASVAGLRHRLSTEVYPAVPWHDPRVPIVSDVHGGLVTTGDAVREDLLDGWTHPVHWQVVTDGLLAAGVQEVWIPGQRTMFSRMVRRSFTTVAVTPARVLEGAASAGR